MWSSKSTTLEDHVHNITLYDGETQLTYEAVISLWRNDPGFRDFYFSILKDTPFAAFFWENPPVTASTLGRSYEFVLIDTPQLARITADSSPFQDRFNPTESDQTVITFGNLSQDAELIVPCPLAPHSFYTHFASFIQYAPEHQKHDLFISLAKELDGRINDNPIWVSTSGLGVYWLHIRLDIRPKYYSHLPYCQFTQ